MALKLTYQTDPLERYAANLRAFIGAIHPALLSRDRWGYRTIRECFGIDADSALYTPNKLKPAATARIRAAAATLTPCELEAEHFLAGVGFDFSEVQEPYSTELKAFFSWSLSRPEARHYDWFARCVRLIPFCEALQHQRSETGDRACISLIGYGHPLEEGNGNGSTPLRAVFSDWLEKQNYSNLPHEQQWVKREISGEALLLSATYASPTSTPANKLIFALIVIRERSKQLNKRNLILLEDIYPKGSIEVRQKAQYLHFYKFKIDWFRDVARSYLLDKILHREISQNTLIGYLPRLQYVDECLRQISNDPQPSDIDQNFIDNIYLDWGTERNYQGQNWYSDALNMLQWASAYRPEMGWSSLHFDKRNVRRVKSYHPKGRSYEAKHEEGLIPEEVVEQIFRFSQDLPPILRRLLVVVRYTGMRSIDLHSLAFDCLRSDPDDPKFLLLDFYQSKTNSWNSKPLLVEDDAHAAVIHALREQQDEVRQRWGTETHFLFPERIGDAFTCLDRSYTRSQISKWIVEKDIRDKYGRPYAFGWHDFRHFYGTELALSGYDIHLIMMELGHASPDMTMVYINKRRKLRKKALVEKGGGRFIDIKGQVDDKMAELAIHKDMLLTVDVPGGLCSLPGQIGEWCEHNRACFTCSFFRADAAQISFFENEKRSISASLHLLEGDVTKLATDGKVRLAEIGKARIKRVEEAALNVETILQTIKAEGSYRGANRKDQGAPSCGRGACGSQTKSS